MGFFELLPETTSYKVIVEHEGKKYDFNFSDILPVGYVMRINDSNEEAYQIEISKSPVLPVTPLQYPYLVVEQSMQ